MTDAEKPTAGPESDQPSDAPAQEPSATSGDNVLAEATVQLVSKALQEMRVAIQNIRLYPEGSPQALRAASSVFAPISTLLQDKGSLTFGIKDEADNRLFGGCRICAFASSNRDQGNIAIHPGFPAFARSKFFKCPVGHK